MNKMALHVLAFSDTRTTLELPDVVFLLGDIPSKMVSKITRKYDCHKVGILGNHCHPQNFEGYDVHNLHQKVISVNGYRIAGFEGTPRYKENTKGQHTEEEAQSFLDTLTEQQIDIFLAHSNPAYGDLPLDDAHRGFHSFNSMILNNAVKYFFHGHLHNPFQRIMNNTRVYSVYPFLSVKLP
ncbi:hypothetical protein FZD47_20260 [Bacillus infantis]|uniref:Calcineurin-like phosphoesterase domain-containing protein n=1 Tax=Bacillus infantis TaxID=324767 RepID=A0A5D4SE01_9BACI|nr:metallophosphoesterase [Bacillus infantis]TYS60548.1 hypothetical protein FZD47_20260 [Bacillus infantis]